MINIEKLNLDNIEDAEFWKNLNPSLSISKTPFTDCLGSEYLCSNALSDRLKLQVVEDGFFQTPVVLESGDVKILRDCVLKLHEYQVMPIFASLYDEYWQALFKLRKFFTSVLLQDYKLVPNFWIWHVAADDESSGWAPHRDGNMDFSSIRNDGTPTLCTVWIALTDVKTTNSCMYALPRKHDLIFQDFVRRKFGQPGVPNAREVPIPLTKLRALPVDAGAMIGWDTNVFHWGSASSKWASEPRISIGIYYQAADSTISPPIYNDNNSCFIDCKPDTEFTFEDRLTILANIINSYIDKFDVDGERDENFTEVVRDFQKKWNRK